MVGQASHSDIARHKLKPIAALLDRAPVLTPEILALLNWAAAYYLHPPGEVMQHALPALLRQGKAAEAKNFIFWQAAGELNADILDDLKRAPKQQQLLQHLLSHADGLDEAQLNASLENWRAPMKALVEKGLFSAGKSPAWPRRIRPAFVARNSMLNSSQLSRVSVGHWTNTLSTWCTALPAAVKLKSTCH